MAKYEVLAETLGANPTHSKGDIIEDAGDMKSSYDIPWLLRMGAIRKLGSGADAPSGGSVAPAGAGPDMVIPPGEAPPAPPDPLAFLTGEQRAALTAAGYGSVEAIRAANDEQLDAVPGIGEATVVKLREATRE